MVTGKLCGPKKSLQCLCELPESSSVLQGINRAYTATIKKQLSFTVRFPRLPKELVTAMSELL